MEPGMDQLYSQLTGIKLAGSKEPLIRIMNDIIKNRSIEDKNLFVIEGLWAYEKIVRSNIGIKAFAFCIESIRNYHAFEMVRTLVDLADESLMISDKLCNKLSSRDDGEGFFLLCSLPLHKLDDIELKKDNIIVVLDGLEKPGNIGTIIRSVDAAGGDGVILCNTKVRRANQKLIKSSMGSGFILPVIESDINKTVMWLKSNGFKIIVTDLKACESYYNVDYRGRIAIIAGNEMHGVSALWNEYECKRVIIPMFGAADSLNVGVAASLVIYEASSRHKEMVRRLIT